MSAAGLSKGGRFARAKKLRPWWGCADCGGPVEQCDNKEAVEAAAKYHSISTSHTVITSTGKRFEKGNES